MTHFVRAFALLGIAIAWLFLAAVTGLPAGAQQGAVASPHGAAGSADSVTDVPAGPGNLRGRVIHKSREGAGADLTVALFALGADGRPGVRRIQSGPNGEFAFERISNNPKTVYLLGVRYGEIPFSLRTAFAAGESELTSVLEIHDARADSDGLELGAVELRVDRGCSGARINESHALRNPSEFIFFVPADKRDALPPIARIPLPTGASLFSASGTTLDEGIEMRDGVVHFWGPLHPGQQQLQFSYSLPARDRRVDVAHAFPNGAEDVRVLTFRDGPAPQGDGLRPSASVSVGELSYAAVASGPVAAGGEVAFSLELADFEENASRLELRSATMWLELDDAALDVREQFEIIVQGDEPLSSTSDAPLLCLPLPEGAEEMRFSSEAFSMGIQPDPTGGLALRGPIPAGPSGFSMTYLLRSGGDSVHFAREFPTGMSLLSIYVADTGVLTETERLHRRRPVRTSDRSYIHLEAYQIDPGETVELDVTSLPVAQPLPRVASVGFVVLTALGVGLFLTAPLRSPHEPESAAATPDSTTATERTSIYAAIRDLEDDFETGKVSAEDRDTMRNELRQQAGELLRAERAAAAAAPTAAETQTTAVVNFCSDCGKRVEPHARFCSHCGAKLAAANDSTGGGEHAG
jgi:hypothetical protein